MKQKLFLVSFLNDKVKVQFLVGIPYGALSLVLAFLSKTGSAPQRQQIHKQTKNPLFNIYIRLNHIQTKELRVLRSV